MRRTLHLALGLGITGLFLWLLLRRLDLDQLAEALLRTRPAWLVAGLVALGLDFTLRWLRWWRMLRLLGADLRPRDCATPYFASVALNNLLPFRLGDAARVFAFRHPSSDGAPAWSGLLGAMVVERLLDFLALLALFFIALTGADLLALPPGLTWTLAVVAGGGGLGLLGLLLLAPWLSRWVARRTGDGLAWAGRHAGEFLGALGMLRSPRATLELLGLTLGAWLLEAAVFVCVAQATGSGASGIGSLLALAAGTLATLLPSSPGYVGTFDWFAMQGWAAHGLGLESAAANALVVHLLLWLPLTLLGGGLLLGPSGQTLWRGVRGAKTPSVSLQGPSP